MTKPKIILTFDVELWHEGEWIKKTFPAGATFEDYFEESITPIIELLRSVMAPPRFL